MCKPGMQRLVGGGDMHIIPRFPLLTNSSVSNSSPSVQRNQVCKCYIEKNALNFSVIIFLLSKAGLNKMFPLPGHGLAIVWMHSPKIQMLET